MTTMHLSVGRRALRALIKAIRIRLDAPYFPRFVVQTLGPTSWSRVGVPGVAESLASLRPDIYYIDDVLSVIERDFCRHDGPGPVGAARFHSAGA